MNDGMHQMHRGFAEVEALVNAGDAPERILVKLEALRVRTLWELGIRTFWDADMVKCDPGLLDQQVEAALERLPPL